MLGAKRAIFVLKVDGLGFAHDGKWFSVANFRSLADGWSDKDPKQCIGHKGLGFRSVLDVTPAPHVLSISSQDFFGFKFTWAMNNGYIQETIRREPRLREEYNQWTKNGQSACPVMAIPGEAKRQGMGGGLPIYDELVSGTHGSGFTTMFWLPAGDGDASPQAIATLGVSPLIADDAGRSRLVQFIEKEISVLLPFLSSLEDVAVYADRQLLARASSRGNRKNEQGEEIHVDVVANNNRYSTSFFQMHSSTVIPPRIRSHPETPRAVRQMDNANLRLSVRLEKGRPTFDASAKFHVYFPTEEPTGFGFTIHGDFYVKPDRTRLMGSAYNDWLLDLGAKKFGNEFLTRLLKQYDAKSIFEALRPASAISHEVARRFHALASASLRARPTPWVPSRVRPLNAC